MTSRPLDRGDRVPGAVVAASEAHVADAARALLTAGAVDAVVAGVFAAAAASRSVLLGPVQLLLGGPGMGLRAVDGRPRQPGIGAPRPRGFVADEPVPAAARVAVPALVATLTATLATSGNATLAKVMAPALAIARVSEARARVLDRVARRGAAALSDEAIARELVAVGGRLAGGILTEEDLAAVRPDVVAIPGGARSEARRAVAVPWAHEGEAVRAHAAHVVAAVDVRGRAAIACYEVAEDGVPVEALDLVAPAFAEPVLRGRTRVRPGAPRPAAAPIFLVEAGGALEAAWGLPLAPSGAELSALRAALEGEAPPDAATLTAGPLHAVGVAWSRVGARAFGGG